MDVERIPVTIITGFLGAGKTTLLNNLIKHYTDKKFAIIENEIGEIGIDGSLLLDVEDNIFELSNGCICCSLNGDFQETLIKLQEDSFEFNHLLIETTGIADPDSVIQPFISSMEVQKHYALDSVISLADAINIEDIINEEPEIRKQLVLSDIILLNKTESISKNYCDNLLQELKIINPTATVYPVSYSNIIDINILDTYSYSAKSIEKSTLSFQNLTFVNDKVNTGSFLQPEIEEHHHHIHSEGFIIPGSFNYEQFIFWIRNYLYFNSKTVYRVKGVLSFANKKEKFIFHSIRGEYMIVKGEHWDEETPQSKLVFIGKHLDRPELEKNLNQLLTTEENH